MQAETLVAIGGVIVLIGLPLVLIPTKKRPPTPEIIRSNSLFLGVVALGMELAAIISFQATWFINDNVVPTGTNNPSFYSVLLLAIGGILAAALHAIYAYFRLRRLKKAPSQEGKESSQGQNKQNSKLPGIDDLNPWHDEDLRDHETNDDAQDHPGNLTTAQTHTLKPRFGHSDMSRSASAHK